MAVYKVKPTLESLEDRFLPSVTDVLLFQQQVPQLHAQLEQAVPGVQAALQQTFTTIQSSLTPAQLQQDTAQITTIQWAINNFPALAEAWFDQYVQNESSYLLQINDNPPSSTMVAYIDYNPPLLYSPSYVYGPLRPLVPTPLPLPPDPTPPDPAPDEPSPPGPDNPVY